MENYDSSVSKERMAVRSGNFNLVKELVKDSSVINKPDRRGWTLLHEAVIKDQFLEIARFLISAGANINYNTPKGGTPFYIACKNGCVLMAEMLIEAGCNINTPIAFDYCIDKSCLEFTPLHIACYNKNLDILQLLLDSNANVNAKEGRRRTPVHFAVTNSDVPALRMLINAGANLKLRDSQGYTPLHHACLLGNMEILDILLENLGCEPPIIDQQTPEGWTLLMLACNFQHFEIAEKLIKCGANTTVVNCVGFLALHLSAQCGLNLFKLLFQNTPIDVIEQCATFRNSFHCYRSLPCIIIDSKAFECLQFLYQSGVSEAVLKCPSKNRGHLISPIVHLLLFTESWSDNELKLMFLELLLSYEFLINPVYIEGNIPLSTISLSEAVVQAHGTFHKDCRCEVFLSLILSKVSSPHKALPSNSIRQIELFIRAARDGFMAALHLLKYSECIEPDDVMKIFLNSISKSRYRWTGHEPFVAQFLIEKCSTSFMSEIMEIKNYISEPNNGDMGRRMACISVYNEIKSNIRVVSLKRMCRFTLRNYIRKQALVSFMPFRSYLKKILLPPFLSKYLLYEMDF